MSKERKIIELFKKLELLDEKSLVMVETATDSCLVVQQLTALTETNNIAGLTALLAQGVC